MGSFRLVGTVLLTMAVFANPVLVFGDEGKSDQHGIDREEKAGHSDSAGHGEGSEFEHGRSHLNEIGVFFGATDEPGHDSEFTWGLDYKRRISERWAVGAFFDYAGGDLRNAVIAPSVFYWPGLGDIQLMGAAGVEFHKGRNEGDHDKDDDGAHEGTNNDATYFLVRLGVAYDFHLGQKFGLVPTVNIDFVNDEEVWVYGVAFTYGF